MRMRILLLCDYCSGTAGTILDHIFSFQKYSKNQYFLLSNLGNLPEWLDLSRFDALVFHYSLIAASDNYISPSGRQQIREFGGFKAAFIQDDYRWINDTVAAFAYMGIHALFPLTAPEIIDLVYRPEKLPGVRKETVLAGYVPQELVHLCVPSYSERPLDVVYRARKISPWMGSHTLQKWQIGERFLRDAASYELKVDISSSEEDRIYGKDWIDFLANSKATLGTESGTSVCDFTGDIQRNVESHLGKHPDADFDTLRDLYFKDHDGKILFNMISPRCFEAAALRTLMILYEGYYSGVLIPWRHYVPLLRDHSNIGDVVQVLRSPSQAEKIIRQAFEEVAKNEKYSYKAMIDLVDRVMDEEWRPVMVHAQNPYHFREFEWLKRNSPIELKQSKPIAVSLLDCNDFTAKKDYTFWSANHEGIEEVFFGSRVLLQLVMVRWDTHSNRAPKELKIVGLLNGKVVHSSVHINANRKAFQVIEFPWKNYKVDTIRVRGLDGSIEYLPIEITSRIIKMGLLKLVHRGINVILSLLHLLWQKTPERMREFFRPFVHRFRYNLERRFR